MFFFWSRHELLDQEKVLSTLEELSFPCLNSVTCHQFSSLNVCDFLFFSDVVV